MAAIGARRIQFELPSEATLVDQTLHHRLSSRGTTNVAQAHKEYLLCLHRHEITTFSSHDTTFF